MKTADTGDLWWKSAVFYCLDVEMFRDTDGNGCGDFAGLTDSIDYLADLGVNCVWLMPFYPSPDRDDGYDIIDFYGVDRRLGDHGDAAEFVRTARSRGIRVIVDLVVNHTSDRHPWFQQAKRSRTSRYRDYYIWRDKRPPNSKNKVFPGEEESVWEWEPRTQQYFQHTFYRHQPDLNLGNPAVRDEIAKIMAFWLTLGVAGFRIDAVPFLLSHPGAPDASPDPHEFVRDAKRFARRRSSEALLMGEVNLPHRQQIAFFGADTDELDAQFDFTTMQATFLSFVRQDARPLRKALLSRPAMEEPVGWVNFLRNHDELTLDQLSEAEREEVFAAYAPDPDQRAYGRGILRRLAPILDGDPRRLRLAYSLLFSLPGAPMLFYGEEIGMGENPDIPGRGAVRSPMQWTPGRNGGFSSARPSQLRSPMTAGGYGPQHVNARAAAQDPDSLFHFVRTLAYRYRSTPEIGWGELEVLDTDARGVLVHLLSTPYGAFLAEHNLADEPATVTVELPRRLRELTLIDLLGPEQFTLGDDLRLTLELPPFGFRWLRAVQDDGPLPSGI